MGSLLKRITEYKQGIAEGMCNVRIEFHLINWNSVKMKSDVFRRNNFSQRKKKRTILADLLICVSGLSTNN